MDSLYSAKEKGTIRPGELQEICFEGRQLRLQPYSGNPALPGEDVVRDLLL